MARGDYRANRSQGELNQLFRRLIGEPASSDYEFRLLSIPFAGSTLGDVAARLRAPDSSFYEKSYLEALATARTLVKLGLDGDVADITTRDRPDVVVHHRGGRVTYVEHTIAGHPDTVSFPRHLEESSLALRELASRDAALRKALAAGYFEARLADPGAAARARPAQIAEAVAQLLPAWIDGVLALHASSPPLTAYNAQISYKRGGPANTTLLQRQGGIIEPLDSAPHVIRAVRKKRQDAASFDPALRPLWLVVTLNAGDCFDVDGSDRAHIGAALAGEATIAPFDRVTIELPDRAPIVRDV